jgi:hypothetical protein
LSQEQDARGQFILCGASYSTNLNVYAHMHIHSNQSSSRNLGLVSRRIISKLAASIMMFLWNHGALKCSTMFYCVLFGSGIVLGIIFCSFCFFLDLLSCPFPLVFAAFWSWKLPFQLYFATFWSSNLSFSLVFATFWCSNCSCRMLFATRIHLGLV